MSFFDQPYYSLTKTHMSRVGIWPEQSKFTRIIRLLTALALAMTFVLPRFYRLNDIWKDKESLMHDMPFVLTGLGNIFAMLRLIQHFDKIKLAFENMERHWEMFKNTSAVIVLDKYAEVGRRIVFAFSIFVYMVLLTYCSLCLSPIILDVIIPLNETRTKICIFHTVIGLDKDKYYWFILVHEFIVSMVATTMIVAIETMFFTWAVHACALFEIIGFAELIESIFTGPLTVGLILISMVIVFTGVQTLMNSKHRDVLMQSAIFIIGQVISLYLLSVPGQELINHSEKIHRTAYDIDWPDMSVKTQKLLIPMLIRSNKPCRFTARKVYVMSMESFSSTIRTVFSYFTIFAQMI